MEEPGAFGSCRQIMEDRLAGVLWGQYHNGMKQDQECKTLTVLEQAVDFRGKSVLEIGCGPGRITRMYAGKSELTVGIEPDLPALDTARESVNEAVFVCGVGSLLPFSSGSFDVVLFTLSLHHHPAPDKALEEARRVMRDDGLMLVIEPVPECEIQTVCRFFHDEDPFLRKAADALGNCGMPVKTRAVFCTDWEFSDFSEMADHWFRFYASPEDPAKRKGMREVLGNRAEQQPLAMKDTLCLTVLAG